MPPVTGGETVALAIGLLAPPAGTVVAVRRPEAAAHAVQISASLSALAWAVLLVVGARGVVAAFHVSPLVAAGGCGAALLAAAAAADGARSGRRAAVGTGLALTAICVGLAGGGEPGQIVVAGPLTASLAVAALLALDGLPSRSGHAGRPRQEHLVVAGALGSALVAAGVGFVLLRTEADRWSVPSAGSVPRVSIVALVLAGAAVALAATLSDRRPPGPLLATGLVLGLAAGPLRAGGDDLAALAVVLAVGAGVAAVLGQATAALALLSLAAACGPVTLVPASRLLAAGTVVAAALGRPACVARTQWPACVDRTQWPACVARTQWPAAWLVTVPGGVALAAGVVDDGGDLAWTLAVAAAVVAAALAVRASTSPVESEGPSAAVADQAGPWRLAPGAVPAALAGAWLLLAPGTWTWTGASLRSYDRGMALALVAAVVTVGLSLVPQVRLLERAGLRGPTAVTSLRGPAPPPRSSPEQRPRPRVTSGRPAWPERSDRPAWPERSDRPAWPERSDRPAWPQRRDRPAWPQRRGSPRTGLRGRRPRSPWPRRRPFGR